MSDIERFDLTEHLRSKVREVFIQSIPDEQMNAMIKQQWDEFFKPRKSYSQTMPSVFEDMIRQRLEEVVRERLKTWVVEQLPTEWDGTLERERFVGDIVTKMLPIVQAAMVVEVTQQALQALKNTVRGM